MRKLFLALTFIAFSTAALAQCNGIFPNNTICGNVSGSNNLPRPLANSVLTGVPGGSNGQIQYNNAGTFGGFTLSGDCTIPTIAAGAITCNWTPSGTGGVQRTISSVFQERGVSVIDYGAVANDNTKAAINAAAFANAFAASESVYCPDGQTFYTGEIVIPSSAARLWGRCALIATGTYTTGHSVVYVSGNTNNFELYGVSITVSVATYGANVSGVILSTSPYTKVKSAAITGGQFGILLGSSGPYFIEDSSVVQPNAYGIYVNASTGAYIKHNNISSNTVAGCHGITTTVATFLVIEGNTVIGGTCGGIWISAAGEYTVTGNIVYNTKLEGIHADSSNIGAITGNIIINGGNGTDFGMSFSADAGPTFTTASVAGNTIYQPAKSGIGISGPAQWINVTGNTIINPASASPVDGTNAGIVIYGGATSISVSGNFIEDSLSHLQYNIKEQTCCGSATAPSNNQIGPNYGTPGSSGFITSVSTNHAVSCGPGSPTAGFATFNGVVRAC